MRRSITATLGAAWLLALGVCLGVPQDRARSIVTPDSLPGTASAVVVDGGAPLVHAGQIFPRKADGASALAGDATTQAKTLLEELGQTLGRAGSHMSDLVKVNAYATSLDDLWKLRVEMAGQFERARVKPAISGVVTELPVAGARVALDAVAIAGAPRGEGRVSRIEGREGFDACRVIAAGPRIFVSGQAESEEDLGAATTKTLASLEETLRFAGTNRASIVQLKAFLQPMAKSDVVARAARAFFAPEPAPPLVLVDWRSSPRQPIEIELIAAVPKGHGAPLAYLTPPALKASPVFSRVASVESGDLVYFSDILGKPGTSGEQQVQSIFETLRSVTARAGTDLRHLVKATYYVSDDVASRALNDLRPRYYDPARPPSASKATVAGVGGEGRSVSLDMIAVTTKSAPTGSP